jgi:tetratricopeptide (TPR) repeat protein
MTAVDAYNRKDFATAEPLLLEALQNYLRGDGGRRTAAIYLGQLYRRSGRYEDAVEMLEQGLPYPGAFKELISIYRFLGKAARKDGDPEGEAENYRKMFSLAMIHAAALSMRASSDPTIVKWDVAESWIEDIRQRCGTLYAYRFEGQEAPGSELLSAADYRVLRSHLDVTGRSALDA